MNAKKERLGFEDAKALLKEVSTLYVAKGKRVVKFDLKREMPDDETLQKHMLGPTGNLRAPTVRKGKTLIVGFNEDVYGDVL